MEVKSNNNWYGDMWSKVVNRKEHMFTRVRGEKGLCSVDSMDLYAKLWKAGAKRVRQPKILMLSSLSIFQYLDALVNVVHSLILQSKV